MLSPKLSRELLQLLNLRTRRQAGQSSFASIHLCNCPYANDKFIRTCRKSVAGHIRDWYPSLGSPSQHATRRSTPRRSPLSTQRLPDRAYVVTTAPNPAPVCLERLDGLGEDRLDIFPPRDRSEFRLGVAHVQPRLSLLHGLGSWGLHHVNYRRESLRSDPNAWNVGI